MIEQVSPQTFFAPPTFRVALADRERLLQFLRNHVADRVIVVDAPAGYGKTWLLGRRFGELRAAGAAVVWLGIEGADAAQFLSMLVEGLARSGIEVGPVEAIAAQGFADVPLPAAVRALAAALEASGVSVTIFVDDIHRLDKSVVPEVLARLVVEAPPSTRFVLSGREVAGLPRSALRQAAKQVRRERRLSFALFHGSRPSSMAQSNSPIVPWKPSGNQAPSSRGR